MILRSKENNKIDGYLFASYSQKKLHCLSKTYEELAGLYRNIPQEDFVCEDRRDMLYRRQLNETKQVFANHLDEISEAFAEVADTVVHASVPVQHKRRALIQYLKKQGIIVKEMLFLEGGNGIAPEDAFRNRISIEARMIGRRTLPVSVLCGLLSVFFARRLMPSLDSATLVGRNYDTFIFEDEPRFCVMSAVSRAVKENEKISGDNFSFEEYNQNQAIMMVADGMGSGEQACRDSRSVIEFMEKFLEAGFRKEKAFAMVNSAIASQTQCCNMTTLDVCAINLLNGDAEFLKAGAAPSYRKRGNRVEEISVDTLPLGSIDELCPLVQTIKLMDSDMLILLSDGVTDALEGVGGRRLPEIISGMDTANPKELSNQLLQYAINCQGGHIMDDMTVLVCSIRYNHRSYGE